METILIAAIAAFLLGLGLISERIQSTILTAPMFFVAFGILLNQIEPELLSIELENESLVLLAELTLALVLFTDAARIDLRLLRAEHDLPARMLSVGFLLVIVAGTGIALLLFPQLDIWTATLLATILAPTDAALAQAVIHLEIIPPHFCHTYLTKYPS